MRLFVKWTAIAASLAATVIGSAQASVTPESKEVAEQRAEFEARMEQARQSLDVEQADDEPKTKLAQWFNWPNWDNWPNWNNWGNWANWVNW